MVKTKTIFVLLICVFTYTLHAQTTYLHCGNLIDGKSNKVQKKMTVIITKNEAANIERTLVAINKVCDDIVVVDSGSTDETVIIAERLGARVVPHHWEGYAANKNLGAEQAQHDWILSIDADEVLSDKLIGTLKDFSPQKNEVYELDRITNYCGDWIHYSGWYPDYKIRLYNKKYIHWQGLQTKAIEPTRESSHGRQHTMEYSHQTNT